MYEEIFLGEVDLFAPTFIGDKEAIIPCSLDFDLEKKKKRKKICKPSLTCSKKSCGGQPSNYFGGLKAKGKECV